MKEQPERVTHLPGDVQWGLRGGGQEHSRNVSTDDLACSSGTGESLGGIPPGVARCGLGRQEESKGMVWNVGTAGFTSTVCRRAAHRPGRRVGPPLTRTEVTHRRESLSPKARPTRQPGTTLQVFRGNGETEAKLSPERQSCSPRLCLGLRRCCRSTRGLAIARVSSGHLPRTQTQPERAVERQVHAGARLPADTAPVRVQGREEQHGPCLA